MVTLGPQSIMGEDSPVELDDRRVIEISKVDMAFLFSTSKTNQFADYTL